MISRSTEPRSRRRLPLEVVVAIILVAVAVAVAVAGAGEPGERMVERRVFTMGSVLEMVVWAADRKTALEASQAAVAAIDAAELRLSTWRSDSELARLNDSPPGVWEPLSAELASDLQSSLDWWRATGGAFDPGVGSLVRAWDLRGRGKVPEPAEILKAHAASGAGRLEIAEGRARRSLPGLILEEGGFGKGVALRDGASAARAAGAQCVVLDFGGQVEVRGQCGDRRVDVADPADRRRAIATLVLKEGSIATSGNSERAVIVEGIRYGHLIDPRSGRPAADWGSVTVWAPDPVAADCLATALFVMGPEQGAQWVLEHQEVEALFVVVGEYGELGLRATSGLRPRLATDMPVRWLTRVSRRNDQLELSQ